MANTKQTLWNGINSNSEDAHRLADFMNDGLSDENKIEVLLVTDKWYMLIGNDKAKSWYDRISEEMKKQHELKTKDLLK